MIVAPAPRSFDEALEWTAEVYRAAGEMMAERGLLQGVADEGGFWPAFDTNEEALDALMRAIERAGFTPGPGGRDLARHRRLGISPRTAATGWRSTAATLDSDGMAEMLLGWLDRYPIVSIEDPLGRGRRRGPAPLHRRRSATGCRSSATIFSSPTRRGCARRPRAGACNAVLIKPNQAGTVTEAKAALDAARAAGWGAIVSARSGETEDVTIVHLAVGWGAGQLKVGSFARSERMAKWNEGLRIEEALGPQARFAGGGPFRANHPR